MIFQILHFSDIHFEIKENPLIGKREKLFDSVKNRIKNDALIIITGDSAFSGKSEEFEISRSFFEGIAKDLRDYTKKEIHIIVIPGNHDCEDLTEENPVRELVLKGIQSNPRLESKELQSFVGQVAKSLSNYDKYAESIITKDVTILHDTQIFKAYELIIDSYKILIFCFNTAFQSILREVPGKMVMPGYFGSFCATHFGVIVPGISV